MPHLRRSTAALALTATCLLALAAAVSDQLTVCDNYGVQRLSCGEGNVIKVEAALYGRADKTTCSKEKPYSQLANTNCAQKGTLDLVKNRCEGKKVCELNPQVVCKSDPCPGTAKYLQTTYTCVPATHLIVCARGTGRIQCDEGQVISVMAANFGRSDKTTCTFQMDGIEDTNCNRDCSNELAKSCNGKNSCIIVADVSIFGDPCYGTYKYLELAYNCEYPN